MRNTGIVVAARRFLWMYESLAGAHECAGSIDGTHRLSAPTRIRRNGERDLIRGGSGLGCGIGSGFGSGIGIGFGFGIAVAPWHGLMWWSVWIE